MFETNYLIWDNLCNELLEARNRREIEDSIDFYESEHRFFNSQIVELIQMLTDLFKSKRFKENDETFEKGTHYSIIYLKTLLR